MDPLENEKGSLATMEDCTHDNEVVFEISPCDGGEVVFVNVGWPEKKQQLFIW